jgi:hypothetical protein
MAEIDPEARVNPGDVRDIIDTELTDSQVNAHINTGHLVAGRITGLAEATMKMIELWLSAHFVAISDPELKSESVGGEWSVSYNVKTPGEGLEATRFGQQAIELDTSGTLVESGTKEAVFQVMSLRRD